MLSELKQPKFYWHLEVSSKCSLACPRCPRTEKPGMYKVTEMDLSFVKSVLTPDVLSNTTTVLLCGGQGDPIYCKDFLNIVSYIKSTNSNIEIKIVTNGSYKTEKWWTSLAKLLDKNDSIVFSVDGWDNDSNNKYRVNSNFDSILLGINTLSKNNYNLTITWSTIVFAFNESNLDTIQHIAETAGATHFQIVQSSLFGSKVPAYIDKTTGKDPLEPTYQGKHFHSDKGLIIPLRKDAKKEYSKNFSSSIESRFEHVGKYFETSDILPSCLLNERGLYIDAEGILYPCSWISHPFGKRSNGNKTIHWKDSLFVKYKNDFNLYKHNLDTILNSNSWNKLTNSFLDKDKHFVECTQKCSKAATMSRLKNYISEKNYKKEDSPDVNLKLYNS